MDLSEFDPVSPVVTDMVITDMVITDVVITNLVTLV
jgi:hypothetical protein